jgi:biopolymer transport protein TolQ
LALSLVMWFWQAAAQEATQGRGLVDLLLRATLLGKFVLLVLLVFSVVSWAIIISKAVSLRRARQQTGEFLRLFQSSTRLAELHAGSATLNESPLAAVFLAAYKALSEARAPRPSLDAITRVMQSAAIDETTKLERSLSWLASTASAAPFIGLFGTVVGIIIAFEGLSQAATASIQAVAPGIAEALIATAAGIAAAVPAVLAYNHYLNQIKLLAAETDGFALRLLNFIEREAQG